MHSFVEEPDAEVVTVRAMRADDINAVVRIDAEAGGLVRPRYFELMIDRAVKSTKLQISLVAEDDGRVVGFVIASLYYGEYSMTGTTASMDAIGIETASRRKGVAHALFARLRRNVAAIGATSVRTEVEWNDFDLLGFLKSEGFHPSLLQLHS